MRRRRIKNAILAAAIGILWAAGMVNAQSNREYRDWQRAQREAEIQRQQYLRTRSPRDYREWQRAQLEAQRELRDYQMNARDDRRDMNRQYRYYRSGRTYYTDNRGAELLRQAVNSGYQQGYREGQMDRQYGRRSGYYNSSTYRSGLFGYQSYIDQNQYQYYFQQGFQRGYEDGFNSRMRYGYRSGNGFNILGNILNTILNITNN
jgi:flagellar biosynthesis/type III secretory pathway protein FliH